MEVWTAKGTHPHSQGEWDSWTYSHTHFAIPQRAYIGSPRARSKLMCFSVGPHYLQTTWRCFQHLKWRDFMYISRFSAFCSFFLARTHGKVSLLARVPWGLPESPPLLTTLHCMPPPFVSPAWLQKVFEFMSPALYFTVEWLRARPPKRECLFASWFCSMTLAPEKCLYP